MGFFFIEIKLFLFLRKSGSLQRAGCNCFISFFVLKQYKVTEQMVLCRIMNISQVSHSENLKLFCFGFQMNINMIYIGTNIVMHHVTKPSSVHGF